MSNKPLRGVAIGAGYFSHFHYDAWSRMRGAEIVGCCDSDAERANAVAKQYGIPQAFTDYRQMLDEIDVDFVDVITRPDTHLEIVTEVARRSLPVICQKPLAPTFADSQRMEQIVRESASRCMVHENFRFQPWYREIKRLFAAGEVGKKLHTISFRNRAGDGHGPEAYLARQPYFQTMPKFLLFEAGIHTVDTFRYLAGEVARVWCKLRKLNPVIAGEDTGISVFEFEAGGMGLYDANRYNESTAENPRYTFGELLFETDRGSIRLYPDGKLTKQLLGEPEQVHKYEHSQTGFAGDCVYATQAHFIDCLQSGQAFETDISDYMKSIAVQEAMYRSAESGAWEHP